MSEAISNIADGAATKAGDIADTIKDRTSGALGAAHDKIGDLQATVADALDSGAEAIPNRTVAARLEQSALWLRETDLADLGSVVRRQLRDHPGRSALIALAMGILVGRAMKD
jgi:hypothetical protein